MKRHTMIGMIVLVWIVGAGLLITLPAVEQVRELSPPITIADSVFIWAEEMSYVHLAFDIDGNLTEPGWLDEWIAAQHADTVYEVTIQANDCVKHFTVNQFLELVGCDEREHTVEEQKIWAITDD